MRALAFWLGNGRRSDPIALEYCFGTAADTQDCRSNGMLRWVGPRSFGQPTLRSPRLTNRTARNRQSVAIVPIWPVRVPVSVSVRPVSTVVPVPIRAPMYPAINARNASWSEGTTNHR
jgi:hypothetical protein